MSTQGYTLIYSIVHGNVVGAVIAPKGTENYPKDKRAFVWRTLIGPLIMEVAEHEEFPKDDVAKVARALGKFCFDEGLGIPMAPEEPKGK